MKIRILGSGSSFGVPLLYNFNGKIVNLEPGFKFCIQYLLKLGIIFLGIRLSLVDLFQYGSKSLAIIVPCIISSIIIVLIGLG